MRRDDVGRGRWRCLEKSGDCALYQLHEGEPVADDWWEKRGREVGEKENSWGTKKWKCCDEIDEV
jgi:hypothetical protein